MVLRGPHFRLTRSTIKNLKPLRVAKCANDWTGVVLVVAAAGSIRQRRPPCNRGSPPAELNSNSADSRVHLKKRSGLGFWNSGPPAGHRDGRLLWPGLKPPIPPELPSGFRPIFPTLKSPFRVRRSRICHRAPRADSELTSHPCPGRSHEGHQRHPQANLRCQIQRRDLATMALVDYQGQRKTCHAGHHDPRPRR